MVDDADEGLWQSVFHSYERRGVGALLKDCKRDDCKNLKVIEKEIYLYVRWNRVK